MFYFFINFIVLPHSEVECLNLIIHNIHVHDNHCETSEEFNLTCLTYKAIHKVIAKCINQQ